MAKPEIEMEKVKKPEKLKPLEVKRKAKFYFFPKDMAFKETAEDIDEAVEKFKEEMKPFRPENVLVTRGAFLKKLSKII